MTPVWWVNAESEPRYLDTTSSIQPILLSPPWQTALRAHHQEGPRAIQVAHAHWRGRGFVVGVRGRRRGGSRRGRLRGGPFPPGSGSKSSSTAQRPAAGAQPPRAAAVQVRAVPRCPNIGCLHTSGSLDLSLHTRSPYILLHSQAAQEAQVRRSSAGGGRVGGQGGGHRPSAGGGGEA